MPEYDVLPVGTTVRVKSRLAPEAICQVTWPRYKSCKSKL